MGCADFGALDWRIPSEAEAIGSEKTSHDWPADV